MSTSGNNPQSAPYPAAGQIAYLLSRYPAASHTFFLREIIALRAVGLSVSVASINPPDRALTDLSSEERIEAASTYYLQGEGLLTPLIALIATVLAHPLVTLRGLSAALRLRRQSSGTSLPLLLAYLAEALLVGRWMRRSNLGHLHVHFGGPVASVGLLTSLAWKLPWSITLHGPDEFFDESRFLLRAKLLSASCIFVISDFTASQVLRIAPDSADKIRVRRLGVEFDALQSLRIATPHPIDAPLQLVSTARLVPVKGHRILLQAYARLLASLPPGTSKPVLTLIGGGPELPALQALASQLGIADSIHWTGSLSHQQTLQRVAASDIFLLPSFAEGLPVSLMEAMALGVPCISTYIAGIPELILDGQSGLLVPAGNVDALTHALHRLILDPSLRATLAARARETVRTQYDLAANIQALAGDIRLLVSPSRPSGGRQ